MRVGRGRKRMEGRRQSNTENLQGRATDRNRGTSGSAAGSQAPGPARCALSPAAGWVSGGSRGRWLRTELGPPGPVSAGSAPPAAARFPRSPRSQGCPPAPHPSAPWAHRSRLPASVRPSFLPNPEHVSHPQPPLPPDSLPAEALGLGIPAETPAHKASWAAAAPTACAWLSPPRRARPALRPGAARPVPPSARLIAPARLCSARLHGPPHASRAPALQPSARARLTRRRAPALASSAPPVPAPRRPASTPRPAHSRAVNFWPPWPLCRRRGTFFFSL